MAEPDEFVKRILLLLEHLNITTSAFADKIGVQRSGISHLLSGRNKPSLDFILKIMKAYPEIDLYWILNGKGNMTLESRDLSHFHPLDNRSELKTVKPAKSKLNSPTSSSVDKIVIFHSDGTFSEYHPKI